jgi:hypothetical protein
LIAALVVATAGAARADIDSAESTNVQEGDNATETDQSGEASSGDAVAGQVVGTVSSGDTTIDATNSSVGASADSDYAFGQNSAASFAGLTAGSSTTIDALDVVSAVATNVQEGSNEVAITQSADAIGGDGVAGQVIGTVTSAGATTDVVAANTSDGASGSGGTADALNFAATFSGLEGGSGTFVAADIVSASATNVQEGDNSSSIDQSANALAGDGVAGQVLGVVSAGDTSIDATNDSTGSEAGGGSADAENFAASFVGLTASSGTAIVAGDVLSAAAVNLQEGSNSGSTSQTADALAGDGVAGQIAGVVTSAAGSADLVLANTSDGASAGAGDATFYNFDVAFTGLNATGVIAVF